MNGRPQTAQSSYSRPHTPQSTGDSFSRPHTPRGRPHSRELPYSAAAARPMARPSRPQSAPVRAPLRAVRKILKFVGTPLDGVPMLQMETHRYDIELKSEDNETLVARAQNTGKNSPARSLRSCAVTASAVIGCAHASSFAGFSPMLGHKPGYLPPFKNRKKNKSKRIYSADC